MSNMYTKTLGGKPRNLPQWLKNENVENLSLETNQQQSSDKIPPRSRITRSNSTIPKEEPKKKLHEYPFIEFKGEIKYCTTTIDIACACDDLLTWINNQQKDIQSIPIAFDMEWPFSYQTGPGKSSVIQLCADENICYVFSIGAMKKLPSALTVLLLHPRVLLHGVNIKNDFRKLQRDYRETNSDLLISKCLDLGHMCNEIKNTSGRWSLERLVNYICQLQINKSNKVRMSKWNVIPLDSNQLTYAAIDVYIGQIIYRKLEKEQNDKTIDDIQHEIIIKKLNLD